MPAHRTGQRQPTTPPLSRRSRPVTSLADRNHAHASDSKDLLERLGRKENAASRWIQKICTALLCGSYIWNKTEMKRWNNAGLDFRIVSGSLAYLIACRKICKCYNSFRPFQPITDNRKSVHNTSARGAMCKIASVASLPASRLLVSANETEETRLYRLNDWQQLVQVPYSHSNTCVAFSEFCHQQIVGAVFGTPLEKSSQPRSYGVFAFWLQLVYYSQ